MGQLIDWDQVVEDARRRYYMRRTKATEDRAREISAERIIDSAVRRLTMSGSRFVSERLLTFTERRALYELSSEQMEQMGIGVCERCGERQFFDAGEMAEMYDPSNPGRSQMLHADCTPEGWDTA
jgi:hypothetical protein